MSYITAIGIATPPNKVSQDKIAAFMIKAMRPGYRDERKLRKIFNSSGIDYRYSVLNDYNQDGDFDFYPNTEDFEPFPSTEKRIRLFRENALSLSVKAVRDALKMIPDTSLKAITHLITVSCTGMYAPGLDIDIVRSLELSSRVQRVCLNFMGCYAAINAMNTAKAFCESDPGAKVLIVCTELCSLHFQKEVTEDNLLANALFGDGSAALVMEASTEQSRVLTPLWFYNDLFPEGDKDMTWTIGDLGFEMKLSSYVPELIRDGIFRLTASLLNGKGQDEPATEYFAIHPGGKRILEVMEDVLGLTKEQNRFSYEVLRNFGNMSSPSVLFVLAEIFKSLTHEDNGKRILSFAFGPGLTIESVLFQIGVS